MTVSRALVLLLCTGVFGACGGESTKSGTTPEPEDSDSPPVGDTGPEDDPPDPDCIEDMEFFADTAMPLLESDCIACHTVGGAAESTRYVLVASTETDALNTNYSMLTELVGTLGSAGVLDKPTGQTSHGGGL